MIGGSVQKRPDLARFRTELAIIAWSGGRQPGIGAPDGTPAAT